MADGEQTYPQGEEQLIRNPAPRLSVPPAYLDHETHALWVHKDLVQVRNDYELEKYVHPADEEVELGDVMSWVDYVKRYGHAPTALLTWNENGLMAKLDYHSAPDESGLYGPGRLKWEATYRFAFSPEFKAWAQLCNGNFMNQKDLVEALEDHTDDIQDPSSADLLLLIRSLRSNVTSTASSELREDGTSHVKFEKEGRVNGGSDEVAIPGTFTIAIPVLKGDAVRFAIKIRLRLIIPENSPKPAFRLSMVNLDRVKDAVYLERVNQARALLPEAFSILRIA